MFILPSVPGKFIFLLAENPAEEIRCGHGHPETKWRRRCEEVVAPPGKYTVTGKTRFSALIAQQRSE